MYYLDYISLLKVGFNPGDAAREIARSHMISGESTSHLWHIVLLITFWYAEE